MNKIRSFLYTIQGQLGSKLIWQNPQMPYKLQNKFHNKKYSELKYMMELL